ncbi:MAG: hypothetical protein ACR5K9_04575 [Wolbachia sp.]
MQRFGNTSTSNKENIKPKVGSEKNENSAGQSDLRALQVGSKKGGVLVDRSNKKEEEPPEDTIDGLKEQNKALKKENTKFKEENSQMQDLVTQKDRELGGSGEAALKFNKKKEELETEVKKLNAQLQEKTEVKKLNAQLQEKTDELRAKETELSDIKNKLERTEKELAELKKTKEAELSASKVQLEENDKQLAELKKTQKQMSTELQAKETELSDIKNKLEGTEKELAELKKTKEAELSASKVQLEAQLEKKDEIIKQLKQGSLSRNRSMCIAIGIAAGLIVGTALQYTTELHMLAIVSAAVVFALVAGGTIYAVSRPCSELSEVDYGDVDRTVTP